MGGKERVRRRDGAGELRAGGLWAGGLVAACLQMVRAAQPRLAAAHHDRRQLLEVRGRLVGAPPPRPPRHALDAVVRHPGQEWAPTYPLGTFTDIVGIQHKGVSP